MPDETEYYRRETLRAVEDKAQALKVRDEALAEIERLLAALGTLERKLTRHAAATREGATISGHPETYLVFAEQAESFAAECREALSEKRDRP